jgi:hypothetical protein
VVQLAGGRSVRCVHAEGLEEAADWHVVLEERLARAQREHERPLTLGVEPLGPLPGAHAGPSPAEAELETRRLRAIALAAPPRDGAARQLEQRGLLEAGNLAGLGFALGLLLVLFGAWGLGVLLLLGSSPWLVAAPPAALAPLLRGHAASRLALLTLILALISLWLGGARRAELARRELGWLRNEIAAYAANVGALPLSLNDLRWRTVEQFGMGAPRDPWGRPYRYQLGATGFELSSTGPDGVPSADDLR